MSILIGADIVPTASNRELFCSGNTVELTGVELQEVLDHADFRIFNLECPLVDAASPIKKQGDAIKASTEAVRGLKAMRIDLVTLANNHIMDHGIRGLESTLQTLTHSDIAYVGVGQNSAEAARPFLFQIKGKKYGVYACAEHEFSIAGEKNPGANPVDLLESPDHISLLKRQCDYVIVLYHGGKEYYKYPSPDLQKVCRKLVNKGADLVICQHSHCLGTYEKYGQGVIVYGQGNFIFDDGDSQSTRASVLVRISNDGDIDYIPIIKSGSGIRLADREEADRILNRLDEDSKQLSDPLFLEQQYAAFAAEYRNTYLKALSGATARSFLFRALNRLTGRRWEKSFLRRKYGEKELMAIQNFIECEAHHELLLKGITDALTHR